jgi:hypothetical protein
LSPDRGVFPRTVFFGPAFRALLAPPAVFVLLRFNGDRVRFFGCVPVLLGPLPLSPPSCIEMASFATRILAIVVLAAEQP